MAPPLGEYPCHHLDHGPDTVEVHREDYEIALDSKEKLRVATGTIRKLRVAYAKVQKRFWQYVIDDEEQNPGAPFPDAYLIDGTGIFRKDFKETTRIYRGATDWYWVWDLVIHLLEAR